MSLSITWDPAKAKRNLAKHGITLEEAATVFADTLSLTVPDEANSRPGDDRFATLGMSYRGRLLVVIHSDTSDVIRIISARRATRRERGIMKARSRLGVREFDFSKGVRGKYVGCIAGASIVVLEPDLAGFFRDSRSVNRALREYRAQRINSLIADLKRRPPQDRQKTIRAQLRRLGHRGGLGAATRASSRS